MFHGDVNIYLHLIRFISLHIDSCLVSIYNIVVHTPVYNFGL